MKQNVGKISTVIEFRYISAVKGGNIHRSMAKIKPVFRLTILKKKKNFSIKDFLSKGDQIGHVYWRNPEWKTSVFVQCVFLQHLPSPAKKLL